MATVILGSQADTSENNGNIAGRSLYGFLTGSLAESLTPVRGASLVYEPGTTLQRMYIYEWNASTPSASTYITRSAIVDPTGEIQNAKIWLNYVEFEAAVTLEAGKQYYVAISANGYSGTVPYYSSVGGVHGVARTDLGSFTPEEWVAGSLPNLSTLVFGTGGDGTAPATSPSIYLECDIAGYALSDVNGDNVIVRNGPVVINGTFPAGDLTVEIGGHPLVVDSATDTTIVCAPVDVFATPLSFGTHTLTVTELELPGLSVSLTIDPEHQVVTLTSVTPPLITQGLSAAVGNQVACLKSVGGSMLEMSPEGDVVYWPAMVDGNSHPRYWYDGSTWDSGPVIINGGPAPGVPSISMFTVLTDTIGEATLKGKTDTTSGTVYAIVDANPTQPTKEQVRDGLNAAGAPALGKGSASVTTTDLAVTITGLPSDTLLYGWLAQWV